MDGSNMHIGDGLPPMIIDNFAGGGGASTGIELALGRSPDVAINHNADAIALHAANHPETLHMITDIWAVKPADVAGKRKVGMIWASPDCKHFSKAKGSSLRDRNIRDLGWVVHRWARLPKAQRPDVILLENVEEFVTWGPVGEDGQPIKEFAGQTFELWVKQLQELGYKVQWREMRACDYGAPTIRKRLFIVARCDGRPIVWPKPTHGDPASKEVQAGKLKPWRAAAEIIDWSLPCPSIFDSSEAIKESLGIRAIRPLKPNTLARVARGMKRYVLDAASPFIVNLTHGGRVEDLAAPLRTITGAHRGEKALAAPLLATMRNSQKPWSAITEPTHTVTAGGAGITLIVPSLTRFNSGATGSDMREPAPTVTANSYIKRPGGAAPIGILAPSLMSLKGTTRRDMAITAPHPTVLAGGGHSAMVAPYLASIAHGDSGGRREYPMAEILGTVTARGVQHALISPTLIQTGYGERTGQAPRALDMTRPLGTVVAGGVKHAACAAFLAQQNGGPRMEAHSGHDAREPLTTIAASGSHQTPVAAYFAKYYGTGDGAEHRDPMHTVTVRDRFAHVQAQLALTFGPEHEARAREVAAFLRAHDAWAGGEFVTLTIKGETYVVVDIGLRMLTPRELFNAQGFPADYVIDGVWQGDDFKAFTKNVQVSCCGNSVCPDMARALVEANCQHLKAQPATQEKFA
ncbi:DNA cytosine methyltransferase [Thioclava sp. GXIMD2076]|uniref:DNA cytosine methyltransferase n=1 Tax=Thioclava sp. GXIMD2076 TaxID=3131931 RepID=UPI0030D30258